MEAMNNNMQNLFDDKAKLTDALTSQKMMTETYNTFTNECATPALRNEFINILNEEHQIQFEIFDEMNKRGWYQTQPAEQPKIDQARQKFTNQNATH